MTVYAEKYAVCTLLGNMQIVPRSHIRIKPTCLVNENDDDDDCCYCCCCHAVVTLLHSLRYLTHIDDDDDDDVDKDAEMEDDESGEGYVAMRSPGPFMSNPEYFDDDDLTDSMPVNGLGYGVSSPQRQLNDNYYNCPPPPQQTVVNQSPVVGRQMSQV